MKTEVTQFSMLEFNNRVDDTPEDPNRTPKAKAMRAFAERLAAPGADTFLTEFGGIGNIQRVRAMSDGSFDFALKIPKSVLDERKREAERAAAKAAEQKAKAEAREKAKALALKKAEDRKLAEQKRKSGEKRRKLLSPEAAKSQAAFDAAWKQRVRSSKPVPQVEHVQRIPGVRPPPK
jgi:hypothetical protein